MGDMMNCLFIGGTAHGQRRSVDRPFVSIPKPVKPFTNIFTPQTYEIDQYRLLEFQNYKTNETFSVMALTKLTNKDVEGFLSGRHTIEELEASDHD
jgi:hypothetical protein